MHNEVVKRDLQIRHRQISTPGASGGGRERKYRVFSNEPGDFVENKQNRFFGKMKLT